MAKVDPPPIYENLADELTGKATLPYILFFNHLASGDTGQTWIPSFNGLTAVGTPTISGTYYQFGSLVYYRIDIIPGTSTTSVSGTTYCNNFPLIFRGFGVCAAVTNAPSAALGMVDSNTNRIYTPVWSALTSKVTVVGIAEAS